MAFLRSMATGARWRRIGRHLAIGGLALLALLAPAIGVAATAPPSAEYQIKAVFLFNFTQFVDGPAPAFADPKTPLVIGILGEDPFGSYLDELVQGEKVGGRPMIIRRFRRGEAIDTCHILFIGRTETAHSNQTMLSLRGRSILTVGDADAFSRQGGMVRFVTEGGKIRLRINVEAAKAGGLTISSKILRSATIVTETKG